MGRKMSKIWAANAFRIAFSCTFLVAGAGQAQDTTCIYNQYKEATVQIEYIFKTTNGGVVEVGREIGTGFIISPEGHVLTNAHVVEPPATITNVSSERYGVRIGSILADQIFAGLVTRDRKLDLALLKLPARVDGKPWAAVPISSDGTRAVGSDLTGLAFSPGDVALVPRGEKTSETAIVDGEIVPWWQTSLGLNRGNSGGPIFGEEGTVVGIAVALSRNAQVVSYVIPIPMAQHLLGVAKTKTQPASECGASRPKPVITAVAQRDIRVRPIPDTVGLAPGSYVAVTYEFSVDPGSDLRVETEDSEITTQSGVALNRPSIGGRILGGSFVIKGGSTGQYHNNIHLPSDVAAAAKKNGESIIHLKHVFSLRDAANLLSRVPAVLTIVIQ